MSVEALRETCLNVETQRSIRITMKDVEEAEDVIRKWSSGKGRDFRKTYMTNYKMDRFELNT